MRKTGNGPKDCARTNGKRVTGRQAIGGTEEAGAEEMFCNVLKIVRHAARYSAVLASGISRREMSKMVI